MEKTAKVLAAGAGHLYGTSLPVGGTNTHAVISAHTGYDRLMFDRLSLGQGHVGDRFTIEVLGHTLAYRVTDIRVIDPDDFSVFGIEAGKDEVSLLTCTPYGVNTRRLVVTGERVDIPDPAPAPDDVPLASPAVVEPDGRGRGLGVGRDRSSCVGVAGGVRGDGIDGGDGARRGACRVGGRGCAGVCVGGAVQGG